MEEKKAQREAVAALLGGRAAVYALLARLWAEPLDEAALQTLSAAEWSEVLPLFDDEVMTLARDHATVAAAAQQQGLAEGQRSFNWCFIGIGTRVAPWESVYAGTDRLIMQPSTLKVREAYARAGFAARNKGAEPDDHVATECDFMAKLAARAQEAFDAEQDDGCEKALAESREFLGEHLACWADDFAAAFSEEAAKASAEEPSPLAEQAVALYGAAAAFARDFYQADLALLDELTAAGVLS